ncbi:MAG: hypothetical protein NPMRth3_3630004 [Nitrosopumilales archaeon]|nr:MAG: hypothetical protein NPMRth3_3630004 [Nitrosopumilales archaeon]
MQYTGLSGFGSKGTSESLPQSAQTIGYIFLSDMILGYSGTIRTIMFFKKKYVSLTILKVLCTYS